jgi:uncharacterized protein YdgA (DUF945 family)
MVVLLIGVAAVSLLVAALLVGTPAVIGPVLESELRDAVVQADASALYDVSVESYDRGLFGADGQLKLTLGEPYLEMLEASMRADMESAELDPQTVDAAIAQTREVFSTPLTIDFEASHGIVTRLSGTRLGLTTIRISADPQLGPDGSFVDLLGTEGPIEGLAHVTVGGDVDFSASVPAGALTDQDQSFEYSDVRLAGHFDRSDGRLEFTLAMDEMAMNDGSDSGAMRGMSARYDVRQFDGALWIGSGRMDIASFTFDVFDPNAPAGRQQSRVSIDGLAVAADSAVDPGGETMSATIEYSIDAFSGMAMSGRLRMPITLSSLDVGAIRAYAELVTDAPLELMDQRGDDVPEALIPIAELLLQNSPAMRIGPGRLELDEEAVNVDIAVALNGERFQQAGFDGLAQLSALGTLVTGSADLDVTRGLAEQIAEQVLSGRIAVAMAAQAPADGPTDEQIAAIAQQQVPVMLGQLAAQRLIVETDTGYKSSLALQPDGISLNGMTVPLQMLMQ